MNGTYISKSVFLIQSSRLMISAIQIHGVRERDDECQHDQNARRPVRPAIDNVAVKQEEIRRAWCAWRELQ
jgi:hypothetical protein